MSVAQTHAISVIIPALNAGNSFEHVLEGVRRQRDIAISDLVVLDTDSADQTRRIATEAGANVVRVRPDRFNHGLTRLDGARRTRADLVVFMTQDALLARPDVLRRMAGHFSDDRVAGVYVRQRPRTQIDPVANRRSQRLRPCRRATEIQELGPRAYRSLSPAEKLRLCTFDNVCSMIRRRALEEHPLREVAFAEDRLWARDVIRAGWRIVYDGRLEVVHSHAPGLRERLSRAYVNHRAMRRFFGYCFVNNPVTFAAYVTKGAYAAAVEALDCAASPGRALVETLTETATAFAALAGLLAGVQKGSLR